MRSPGADSVRLTREMAPLRASEKLAKPVQIAQISDYMIYWKCQIAKAAMDEIDRRLIALLRADARTPVATLAKTLKVSRGTVQNRIDRMLARGDIGGFTIRVRRRDGRRSGAGDHGHRRRGRALRRGAAGACAASPRCAPCT